MSTAYVPDPRLEAWRAEMQIKEAVRHEAMLAKRMKCPACGELGVWLMTGCRRHTDEAIPDAAYCQRHAPGGYAPHGKGALMVLNSYGWLDEGDGSYATWEGEIAGTPSEASETRP